MAETTRLTGRPQVRERQAVQLGTAARQGDYLAAMPRGGELQGLLTGLSALNPSIQQLRQDEAAKAAKMAEDETRAAAEALEGPREALTGAPIKNPVSVPPALADDAQRLYVNLVSARASVKIKADAVQEYHSLKDTEGFNHESWLAESRGKALAGLSNPTAVAAIGKSFTELEGLVRQDAESVRMKRIQQGYDESMAVITADVATANKTPQELYQQFQAVVVPSAKQMGKSRNEAAQLFLGQLSAQSMAAGGVPELFDAFLEKDEQGRSLSDYNPALGSQAMQARAQAVAMRDKAIEERTQPAQAKTLMQFETDLEKDPFAWNAERIEAHLGKFDAWASPEAAASALSRLLDAQRRHAAADSLKNYNGPLFVLEKGLQNKIMDARLGPVMQQLLGAEKAGDVATISQLAMQMATAQSKLDSNIPWDQLKNWVETTSATLPAGGGPPPRFLAAVEVYKAMSRYPGMRERYFDKEDAAKVIEAFAATTAGGGDPTAAYQQAHASISPAAKAAAKAYAESPEFKALADKEGKKWVEGSSWWPRLLGGNGRPDNGTAVSHELRGEMMRWRSANPYATDKDAEAYAENWTSKNFVLDTTTSMAVRVPPGLAGATTQEAISVYTKRLSEELKLGSRSDADWRVVMAPSGTEGLYNVMAFAPGKVQQLESNMDLAKVVQAHNATKHPTDDEAKLMGGMLAALGKGEYTGVDLKLMAKGEALGIVKPAQIKAHRDAMAKAFTSRLQSSPKMDLGEATSASLQHVAGRTGKVDAKLTASVALQLTASPMFGPAGHHMGLAASLVTMGEGVALQTYDDPAHNAGRNIGMGYNLKANEGTSRSDLKRAGVPEERIEEVIAGSRALLPEQAQRLLQLTLPRYEKQAKDVANATSPGLWERMQPAQKAVLIDIAYQTGDPGQFKKAMAALAAGKSDEFQQHAVVTYVNHSGERVADKRRNGLRASMLAGIPHWESTVQQYGSLPANKLQAMALTTK